MAIFIPFEGTSRAVTALFFAVAGYCAPFRRPGCPGFRRERHTPKRRTLRGELQTNLYFAGTHRSQERYVAFLLLFGPLMFQENGSPAGKPGFQQSQTPVTF